MSRDCAWCDCATYDYAIRKGNLICRECADAYDAGDIEPPEDELDDGEENG